MKRDLSLPYHFLKIAEVYKEARNHDFALKWVERGLKAFPDRTDSRLREFLAEAYRRLKRHDEAMALIWAEFAERPVLEQYRNEFMRYVESVRAAHKPKRNFMKLLDGANWS